MNRVEGNTLHRGSSPYLCPVNAADWDVLVGKRLQWARAAPQPEPGQRQQQSPGVVPPLSSTLRLHQMSRPCPQPFFPSGGYSLQKELLDSLCSDVGKVTALQVLPVPN